MLYWYEGKTRKAKAIGRFKDVAGVRLNNKVAELKNTAITGKAAPKGPGVEPEPKSEQDATGHDLLKAVDAYLHETLLGKSHKTYLAYNVTLKVFAKGCKTKTLEDVSRDDVLDYLNGLRDGGRGTRRTSDPAGSRDDLGA
jgi:hypothetical protein